MILEQHCRDLYKRTRELWQSLEGQYPTWECRFSILYGPPIAQPDLFIIGQNPGFDPNDLYDEEIQTWPAKNEYTNASWPLATKLRALFAKAGLERLLEQSVGTNLWFFKSKGIKPHETGLGWEDNPAAIQQQLETWCAAELAELTNVLHPRAILVLGLGVFDQLADQRLRDVQGVKGRRVASIGWSNGVQTIGIIHPTGARVSRQDWDCVAIALAEVFGEYKNHQPAPEIAPVHEAVAPAAPRPPVHPVPKPAAIKARQQPFRKDTTIKAGKKPTSSFAYRPVHDFWQELAKLDEISIEDFHHHMVKSGWRRPQGGPLTYDVTRTDVAYMCKNGLAIRVRG